MHYHLIDIQADFEINRPIRYQITTNKIFPETTDGLTETSRATIGSFCNKKKNKKNTENQMA